MTEEDREDFENNIICRFFEREKISDKVRDHCHLTGKYRGPALSKSNIDVKQSQSNFSPIAFHNFSIYDCHFFSKCWLIERRIK